jgi:hypothetical protein
MPQERSLTPHPYPRTPKTNKKMGGTRPNMEGGDVKNGEADPWP